MISHAFLNRIWYEGHPLSLLFLPVSWIYSGFIKIRRFIYLLGLLPIHKVDVPVIIVGNLTVGGTGKTPLIIWLATFLIEHGHQPGIISRGYGGNKGRRPQQVRADSDPYLVGDEPVLIAQRTGCPVAVSTVRYTAATELLEHTDCDVILCDDGLQHLVLAREFEIAVIDGDRRFGNGHCLPAGPLREPVSRLLSVDVVVGNGKAGKNEHLMEYQYGDLCLLQGVQTLSIDTLRGKSVHVVTGIGHPARLYAYLQKHEIRIIKHAYPDHHHYSHEDVTFNDNLPVVMTEKDAVKCRRYADGNMWYIPVTAQFSDTFNHRILIALKDIFDG